MKIFSLLSTILSFRLLTLDQLYEKTGDTFIMNYKESPKLAKVNMENMPLFYVVLHSRKLLFYTKGLYYGFSYDSDNIKLKLGEVNVSKIEYYTQDIAILEKDDDDNNIGKGRTIKVLKWDDLIKNKGKDKKLDDNIEDDIKNITVKHKKEELSYPTRIINRKEEISYRRPIYKESCKDSIGTDSHYDVKYIKAPEENKNNHINNNKKPHKKDSNEIESDSEMLDSKLIDIQVETINKDKKTFVLKNKNNSCVTYFEKSFILAECRKSKRQIFKLVNVEDVIKKLNLKKEPNDDLVNEENPIDLGSIEQEPNEIENKPYKVKIKTKKKHKKVITIKTKDSESADVDSEYSDDKSDKDGSNKSDKNDKNQSNRSDKDGSNQSNQVQQPSYKLSQPDKLKGTNTTTPNYKQQFVPNTQIASFIPQRTHMSISPPVFNRNAYENECNRPYGKLPERCKRIAANPGLMKIHHQPKTPVYEFDRKKSLLSKLENIIH